MEHKIAVIGLGYVGLPLAAEFSKKYPVTGYDRDAERVKQLGEGFDRTGELRADALTEALSHNLRLTSAAGDLSGANTYIVTVPTPVNEFKQPDIGFLLDASEQVGKVLSPGDLVIYESTVYPGCTEEDCVPVLERASGLRYNRDFFCGYSPERINPGDREHTLTTIVKVTSGSTPAAAAIIDLLYSSIITAGTYRAASIKVAEASKAAENAQRDVNISFINELALIFDRMNIDTADVLEAAGTKWNFLKFRPGLVGGHCIGVDPYYLSYKAESLGYIPEVILSGRRINEQMGSFIAKKVVQLMIMRDLKVKGARALILGVTFKENCTDIRNSRVRDIYSELAGYGVESDVYDPHAEGELVWQEYGIALAAQPSGRYDAIILAVGHEIFKGLDLAAVSVPHTVVFDSKGLFPREMVTSRL